MRLFQSDDSESTNSDSDSKNYSDLQFEVGAIRKIYSQPMISQESDESYQRHLSAFLRTKQI